MSINSSTKITAGIDWVQVTQSQDNWPYPHAWPSAHVPGRGKLNYDVSRKFVDGRVELVSMSREDMKTHVIMSGDAIRNLTSSHCSSHEEILDWASKGSVTRVDIYVDVRHGSLSIEGLRDAVTDGTSGTKAENSLYMKAAIGSGETLYVGSPKSNKRLRVYDKQAESKTGFEWTRIELQLRQKYARRAVWTLHNKKDWTGAIAQIIRGFVPFEDNHEWQAVVGASSILLPPMPDEKSASKREDWLYMTAAKALAKEVFARQDHSIAERFIDYYESHLELMQSKIVSK